MSLRVHLNNLIRERGYLSYDEVVMETILKGHKVETASRVLRPSKSPLIESIPRNGSIIGYKWKGIERAEEPKKPTQGQSTLLAVDIKPTNAINI